MLTPFSRFSGGKTGGIKPLHTGLFTLAVFALVLACLCLPAGSAAAGATSVRYASGVPAGLWDATGSSIRTGGKALILVIDRIGIDDLSANDAPNINKLISSGGFALMNTRIVRDVYGQGNYLVIGAGGRALAGPNAGLSFNSSELLTGARGELMEAGNIYYSRTGRRAPGGSVVNLYIEEIIKNSSNYLATSEPGLMADTLKSAKKKIAVLGNADSLTPAKSIDTRLLYDQEYTEDLLLEPDEEFTGAYSSTVTIHREIACIAMDGDGIVDSGDVSAGLTMVNSENTNLTTDFGKLVSATERMLPENDVMVIDLGQTSRVDEESQYYTEDALEEARSNAVRQCDEAVGKILKSVDLSKDMVMVCTPTPSYKMISKGELLTPLIVAGPGFKPGTLLRSSTTKRSGVVSNFDIAPTVLDFYRLDTPGTMEGRPLEKTESVTSIEDVKDSRDNIMAASVMRKALVKVYVIAALVLLILFLLCVFFREDFIANYRLLWNTVLLTIIAGPLAYLIYPLFGKAAWYRSLPWILGICVVSGLAAAALEETPTAHEISPDNGFLAMIAVSGVTLLIALLDPLFGSPLMTFSAFGSDIIMGARYYGIGNLYMGVIVGSALLFCCLMLEVLKKTFDKPWKRYLFACAVFLLICFFIGYPGLGANVGGLITAVIASVFTLIKLDGKPLNWRRLLTVFVAVVVCAAILLLVVSVLPEQASHAGKAVSRIKESGISSIFSQAIRKLSTSWLLTFASIWRLLLLLTVIGGILVNWKLKLLKKLRSDKPYLLAGMTGMAAGLVAALFFNDSGIEPASAISIFLFMPLFMQAVTAVKSKII